MDFTGVSAFPLTPHKQGRINFKELTRIIKRINNTQVSSIGALGSTGSYMYLTLAQRSNILRSIIDHTDKPVIANISDLTLENILRHTNTAHKAGAQALLLAPVSYQPLTADEVYSLYYQVDRATDLPLIIYDNPTTTGFTFTDNLYQSISDLPSVQSIKLPPPAPGHTTQRSQELLSRFPQLNLGISGDPSAVPAISAGIPTWYSVLAGVLPDLALALYQAAQDPSLEKSQKTIKLAQPLFGVYSQYGSYRTIDALALISGLTTESTLTLPIKSIPSHTQTLLGQWYDIYLSHRKKGL